MMPKPQFQSKTKRLPKGKAVTICAGFKSRFGIVLCADSQETVGAMKFDAPKLVIRPEIGDVTDKVRMLFAGAGDGPFIDKLVNEMWKAALAGPEMECEQIIDRIENKNLELHEKYWRVYSKDEKPFANILFAIVAGDQNPRLFRAMGPIINEVENYGFVGNGLELGTFLAENFRPDSVDIEEDASAALFILENAKKYVDSCGGDTQIAALLIDGSILTMQSWKAAELAEGYSRIAQALYYLFGEAVNLENSAQRFNESIRGVMKEIRETRGKLGKSVPHRIKVPKEIRETYLPLYAKIEWPPFKEPPSIKSSELQTSEDQP
jgi:hypothetical protein